MDIITDTKISQIINESINVKYTILKQTGTITKIIKEIICAYRNGNKLLICGNGGSAADSQHFAAELIGRFKQDRKGLPAIELSTDTSILTSIGNDYGFENIFKRQVEANGNKGDILIGISTSGNSKNIIEAVKEANKKGIKTICLLGRDGGLLKNICDLQIIINSDNTARIQESHITIIHIICEIVEQELFKKNNCEVF
ncbi:MAG: D-sedoheptulose 7-phosphate isomerase [Candidatus Woesearchaeota archaeon]